MAKPNHPQKTPKQQALTAKRERNHSPEIERKRAENAWHTNPLAPIPPKVLRKQAQSLMRTLYQPAFKQLSSEEQRQSAVNEKRKADNAYYLNWLNQQSELLNAHEDAARTQVLAAGQQAQAEVQQGWEDLHSQLIESAGAESGVSGPVAGAAAFNLSDEALKSAHDVQEQRQLSQDQIATSIPAASTGHAVNFAQIAALEGKRQSEDWETRGKLSDARNQLRGERASEAAKEFTRGSDKEVEKAQARAQIAASEATAAIEAKRFGLDARKAGLEAQEFNFEKQYKNKKLGLEKLTQRQQNEIDRGELTVAEAEAENKKKQVANEGKPGERTPGELADDRQDAREKNQQINANITTVLTAIQHNPRLRKMASSNYPQLEQILRNKYGYNPLAIAAAAQLYSTGEVSDALKEKLRAVGYSGKYV